jgi:hypothetical protein
MEIVSPQGNMNIENPPRGGLHNSALAGTQDPKTKRAFVCPVYHNRNRTMKTLRLKDKSTCAVTLINGRQVAVRYTPKKKAYGITQNHMDLFVGQPIELRLSTGEILAGRFALTRYDILLDCDDGRALCCRLTGSET